MHDYRSVCRPPSFFGCRSSLAARRCWQPCVPCRNKRRLATGSRRCEALALRRVALGAERVWQAQCALRHRRGQDGSKREVCNSSCPLCTSLNCRRRARNSLSQVGGGSGQICSCCASHPGTLWRQTKTQSGGGGEVRCLRTDRTSAAMRGQLRRRSSSLKCWLRAGRVCLASSEKASSLTRVCFLKATFVAVYSY